MAVPFLKKEEKLNVYKRIIVHWQTGGYLNQLELPPYDLNMPQKFVEDEPFILIIDSSSAIALSIITAFITA